MPLNDKDHNKVAIFMSDEDPDHLMVVFTMDEEEHTLVIPLGTARAIGVGLIQAADARIARNKMQMPDKGVTMLMN